MLRKWWICVLLLIISICVGGMLEEGLGVVVVIGRVRL